MAIKGCKSIAEYAIRRWMEHENFVDGYFSLEMDGNEGTIKDRVGDTLVLVYDPATKEVFVRE